MGDRSLSVLGHYLSSNIIHLVIEPSSRLQGKGGMHLFLSMLIQKTWGTIHMETKVARSLFLDRGLKCMYRHMKEFEPRSDCLHAVFTQYHSAPHHMACTINFISKCLCIIELQFFTIADNKVTGPTGLTPEL